MAFILPFKGTLPTIDSSAYVSPSATIAGDVHIGAGSSIWFNVAIRGDVNHVRIGENTNLQDGTVCHVTYNKYPLIIGSGVTVGHSAILHGCTLEDGAFVGMGATVMDGATVESGAMVAAGALVSPGKVVKSGELWSGIPAKKMRNMTGDETDYLPWSAEHYRKLGAQYESEA
ncbi:MAG: gamma carbonic anhydrase family protein [Alphaproteobacteria bacterium]|nr:gamma carbonic anhydrase family protein [Alphaproteobacteria bacterium]